MNSISLRILPAIALLLVAACGEQKVDTSQGSEASTDTTAALVERAGAPLFRWHERLRNAHNHSKRRCPALF